MPPERNFCEVSNRSGTASEIDRERADSQINGTQEENSLVASAGGSKAENQSDLENTSNEKNPKIMNPHWEDTNGMLDEYGGLSGIITLHDLIEELVGEIEEEEQNVNSREYKRGTRSIYPGDVPV